MNLPGAWPITDDVGAMRDRIDAFASGAGACRGPASRSRLRRERGGRQRPGTRRRPRHRPDLGSAEGPGRRRGEPTWPVGLSPAHLSPARPLARRSPRFRPVAHERGLRPAHDRAGRRRDPGGDAHERPRGRGDQAPGRPRSSASAWPSPTGPAGPLVTVSGDLDAITSPQLQAVVNDPADLRPVLHRGRSVRGRVPATPAGCGCCSSRPVAGPGTRRAAGALRGDRPDRPAAAADRKPHPCSPSATTLRRR